MKKKTICSLAAAIILTVAGGCENSSLPFMKENQEAAPVERSIFAMNTYMTLTAYGDKAEEGLDAARDQIYALEDLWSVTDENSDIYKANHSGGQAVEVSDETASLVGFALDMARQTRGALNPAIYPVLEAWGFTTDSKQVPSREEIDRLLENTDYTRIKLDGNMLTVPDGMEMDLGSVGKGYAADLVTETLKDYGVESAILSLGGNIQAIGSHPDGTDWRIGIRAPWEEGYIGILSASDAAVVTSGGYENYFEDEDGHIYWHILDPSTGRPAESGLQSVTIIGAEGRMCDALSTSLFVMGAEKARDYWQENGGFDMILVTDDRELLITEGITNDFAVSEGWDTNIQILKKE